MSLVDYQGRVGKALAKQLGPGWSVQLRDTAIELAGGLPAVRAGGIDIRNPAGVLVVRSPYSLVSLDPVAALLGNFGPREIELRGLEVRGSIASDGSITFLPLRDGDSGAAPAAPARPEVAPDGSPVAAAVASLLDPITRSSSIVGAIDRAKVLDATLTLIGPDGRERVKFTRLDAQFDRRDDGRRQIDVTLQSGHGTTTVRGTAGEGPDKTADLDVTGLPLADVGLLGGLSDVGDRLDMRMDVQVSTSFRDGRLANLSGRYATSAATIGRTDRPPIKIDQASGRATWDEPTRRLALDDVTLATEGTTLRLSGGLEPAENGAWRLRLAGRDQVVAGLTPRDAPIRVDDLSATVALTGRSATFEAVSLKGPGLDVRLSGAIQASDDGPTMTALIESNRIGARQLVRLWPDSANPLLRDYLARSVVAGTIDRLRLAIDFDTADFRAAFSPPPFSDRAIKLDIAASDAALAVVDGFPPLRGLSFEGTATGTSVQLAGRGGRLDMPDGRSLAVSEASYTQRDIDKPGNVANVAFRIEGGADGVASLMRMPLMREVGAIDIDPATVRGKADFRGKVSFRPKAIGNVAALPLSITGTLSDIVADKAVGKERVEAGNFSLSYDGGSFGLKGDARIGGLPASVELQAPKGGTPEATVLATLDETVRAKRGLPGAPTLAGPIPLKILATFPAKAKPLIRVEADLAKAAIDGLVPGWQKAAGKPGRVVFSVGDGDGIELRDIQLDAGPAQVRGSLSVGTGGAVERADLTVFRLSPGDDARIQLDHAGGQYRVVLKGNNMDARPFMRWMAAPTKPGSAPVPDVDLDLALNILSGHNDEAMTGVIGKLSTRGGEPRTIQFAGRFKDAALEAQLGKVDAGAPVLTVRGSDAGATLRFLDLYRRMIGGQLSIDARSTDAGQQGQLNIENFGLRDEPALRRITAQASSQNQDQGRSIGEREAAPVFREDQVRFNRLFANFRRSSGRVDFKDTVIYGPQVGFNLSGYLDYARERLDVIGTFVPAYMLNNVFSQLPVLGVFMGGGRNEGLFAVDFRVTGPVASPNLTVNPLTAVAPGILRKLFGWMLEGGDPNATSAVAPPPAPAATRRGSTR